jgi:putative tricarboxylic transport membrane protein
MLIRGSFLPFFLVLTFVSPATRAWAQSYEPSRPIELVVHSAPGGGSDVFARAVVEMVQKEKLLPQSLRVVNKTEGASIEAMAYLMEKRRRSHARGLHEYLGGNSFDKQKG